MRKVTIQKEFSDEVGIIWRDMLTGFYGEGDDIDINAVFEDLSHAFEYAVDLKQGAPFYPASGDDYVIARWNKETQRYDAITKARANNTCVVCGDPATGAYKPDLGTVLPVCVECYKGGDLLKWLEVNGYEVPTDSMLRS